MQVLADRLGMPSLPIFGVAGLGSLFTLGLTGDALGARLGASFGILGLGLGRGSLLGNFGITHR